MSAEFALLPSQEALLQRLHLNASYTRQLQVVTGIEGAGKTTLVTALADELEGYNSALVICPEHADCAEIRRKILIQLTSSPIFDDEHPLAETLFRLKKELTQPLHIIIDDAHLLPLTLWAECLVLSQLECGGKPISLTFTATPEFMAGLCTQMTAEQKSLLLPVQVGSLTINERETLFNMLLDRTGEQAFLPESIISDRLMQQSGLPAEVVSLLERALNPTEDTKASPLWLWVSAGIASVVCILAVWQWQVSASVEPEAPEPVGWAINQALRSQLEAAGEQVMADYQLHSVVAEGPVSTISVDEPVKHLNGAAPGTKQSDALHGIQAEVKSLTQLAASEVFESQQGIVVERSNVEALDKAAVEIVDTDSSNGEKNKGNATVSAGSTTASTEIAEQAVPNTPSEPAAPGVKVMPVNGFGIQLASVKEQKSLERVLATLAGEADVRVLKDNTWLLVVQGNYPSQIDASNAAARLVKDYQFKGPWVRKWSSMQGYSLYRP